MLILLLLILGLAIGSFLNVLIDRIPNNESPFKGRSYCDKCKKTLKWHDLIPLVSYLYLKGKCRYCRAHISFYYPLVELITGVMFVIVYKFTISTIELPFSNIIIGYLYYLLIFSCFIVIFFTDLKYGIILDKIIYSAIVVSLIYHFSTLSYQLSAVNYLASGLGAFIFFFVLYLTTRGKGMGFGDVKLAFLLGIILGFPKIIIAFYLAFLTGAIVGSILIIWGKKKLKGGTIPFGPFLIIGAVLSLSFGEKIIHMVLPWLSF